MVQRLFPEHDTKARASPGSEDVDPSPGAILEIRLLGHPEFRRNGDPLPPLATRKTQSLLAYLILHCIRHHTRDQLATQFWGDLADRPARRSLATALWRIRRLLADDNYLLADATTIQFNPASHFWLDVTEFEKAALLPEQSQSRLQSAVNLYRGDLLEGLYDDWCIEERYRLEELYLHVLQALVDTLSTAGQAKEAIRYSDLILARDPLREDIQRTAVRLYMQLNDNAAAIRQARSCRAVLRTELGVEPTTETSALFDELLGPSWRRDPATDTPFVIRRPRTAQTSHLIEHPPFVGRDAEMATLLDCWNDAKAGRGKMVCISGEAGIGKSRLVANVCQSIRRCGGWIAQGNCYEFEKGSPHAPLIEILRSVVAERGTGVMRCLSSWQIAELGPLVPELEEQLAGPRGRIIPNQAEQTRLFNAMTSFLLELAQEHPLLLVLEDTQWANDSTLAWLHYCARQLSRAPILLLATLRNEETSPGDRLPSLLAHLLQKGQATRIELPRLTQDALAHWLEGASPSRVTQIYRQTEGHPLFVLETLRSLVEEGQVRLDEDQWVETSQPTELPLPDSVRQLIQMRQSRLSPGAARLLDVAAVIGRAFDFDILEYICGQSEEEALVALDELTRKRLVREGSGPFAKDYEFDHHLIREVVYHTLHHRRRQSLHLRVAEAMVALRHDSPVASEVAFHFIRAEDWAKAQEYLLKAGDQAGSMAADAEAMSFYQQALDAYARAFGDRWEPLQRAALERKMGEICFQRGDYGKSLEFLQRALTYLGDPFPTFEWSVRHAIIGQVARQLGHRLIPRLFLKSGSGAVAPELEEALNIYMPMGWIDALLSNKEPYLLVSLRALNVSETRGYARGIACGATAVGIAADLTGLFRLAEYYHRRALAASAQIDHIGVLGFTHFGMAHHAYLIGEDEQVLEHAHQSAAAFEKTGDPHRWALVNVLMAEVHNHRGDFGQALKYGEALSRVGQEGADLQIQCYAESTYGLAERHLGRSEEAIAHLRQALDFAKRVPDHMSSARIGGELARCYVRCNRWEDALGTLEASWKIAVQYGVSGEPLARFLNSQAEVYLYVAEHRGGDWIGKARGACRAALKQCQGFRPGIPEAMRLMGTYEWLRRDPDRARQSWRQSLELAETQGHRYDQALTYWEMGKRQGDQQHLRRAEAILAEIGAESDSAKLRELGKS